LPPRTARPAIHPVRHRPGIGLALGTALCGAANAAGNYPITGQQRDTAQRVAAAGVPLSELSPNAPDVYTVKSGDTLWDISKLYLKSPVALAGAVGHEHGADPQPAPDLPGAGAAPGKDRRPRPPAHGEGDAVPSGTTKLSPRVRGTTLDGDSIPSIPFNLIEPFLNEAVVFNTNELAAAPRIVATQEGRVLLSRGDTAYVRGELSGNTAFRIFREPKPLKDPGTGEILGYEAVYVGATEAVRPGETRTGSDGKPEIIPATFNITMIRQEANVGDRLAPVPQREFANYAPHAPASPLAGRIVSLYGDALTAGQNQIVAINRGARDGVERGMCWRCGVMVRR
jgi:hypothetical protein